MRFRPSYYIAWTYIALLCGSDVKLVAVHRLVLEMSYEALRQHCRSADLAPALEMQPAEGLACLGAAVAEVCKCCA